MPSIPRTPRQHQHRESSSNFCVTLESFSLRAPCPKKLLQASSHCLHALVYSCHTGECLLQVLSLQVSRTRSLKREHWVTSPLSDMSPRKAYLVRTRFQKKQTSYKFKLPDRIGSGEQSSGRTGHLRNFGSCCISQGHHHEDGHLEGV